MLNEIGKFFNGQNLDLKVPTPTQELKEAAVKEEVIEETVIEGEEILTTNQLAANQQQIYNRQTVLLTNQVQLNSVLLKILNVLEEREQGPKHKSKKK